MATPNSPSSSQAIIDKFLTGGFSTESTSNPYTVPVTPYVPPSTPDPVTPDPCPEGYTFDSVLNVCVPIEEVVPNDENNPETTPPPYEGVGSVFSPEQNAFMNLGLGELTGGKEIPSRFQFDSAGNILKSALSFIPPFGLPLALGRMNDINTLLNSGVIEKGSDGKLTFAKGGNLNLVQANQAFEQDLARQQGLNLDAQAETPYDYRYNAETKQDEPVFMKQSRGDKADDMGNVYAGLNVTSQPFQSKYGASTIKSYSNNSGDTSGGRSMQNFKYKDTAKTGAKAGFRYGL
tara:strand:- start:173 stop:1045 length:873 start_codon:yes stop_codon:yes gene_type:complete